MKRYRHFKLSAGIEKLRKVFINAEWKSSDSHCNDDSAMVPLEMTRELDLEPLKVDLSRVLKEDDAA